MFYSKPEDKRDLLLVFGLDKNPNKDNFFIMQILLLEKDLEKILLDSKTTNIEDRIWVKKF